MSSGGYRDDNGFSWPEELQRDPDPPPGSWGWFWVGFAIVAGVLAMVWWL
jgi:hypothetical protein